MSPLTLHSSASGLLKRVSNRLIESKTCPELLYVESNGIIPLLQIKCFFLSWNFFFEIMNKEINP